ncbi:MAG: FHA domain-containing protein [Chloroflexi bacterium]|nr:FHA domain-containing protein [Chloroflexota bacterium]
MSASQKRLKLKIDVFEEKGQRAMPLPTLKPPELVEAILQEFRELEYLSDSTADYHLLKADDASHLNDEEPLRNQIGNGTHLVIAENEESMPQGTARPSDPVYLREQVSGKVYKLHWQPAIIGRPDKNQSHNDHVAVDLESYKTGLRVSRRHAQISEKNGNYFIASMSRNPTFIRGDEGDPIPVSAEKRPLQNGDIIHLERSNIALKFIIRNGGSK